MATAALPPRRRPRPRGAPGRSTRAPRSRVRRRTAGGCGSQASTARKRTLARSTAPCSRGGTPRVSYCGCTRRHHARRRSAHHHHPGTPLMPMRRMAGCASPVPTRTHVLLPPHREVSTMTRTVRIVFLTPPRSPPSVETEVESTCKYPPPLARRMARQLRGCTHSGRRRTHPANAGESGMRLTRGVAITHGGLWRRRWNRLSRGTSTAASLLWFPECGSKQRPTNAAERKVGCSRTRRPKPPRRGARGKRGASSGFRCSCTCWSTSQNAHCTSGEGGNDAAGRPASKHGTGF